MNEISPDTKARLEEALGRSGLRATRQREHVYNVLLARRDHPTAEEVFARAKDGMPTISLATVYNCLETLVACDLVKRLNYEREPGRFCPNDGDHAHFMDESTGRVFDITLPESFNDTLKKILPNGFVPKRVKLSFVGRAPENAAQEEL